MDSQSNSTSKICPLSEPEYRRSFCSEDEADITPMIPKIAKPSKFSKGTLFPSKLTILITLQNKYILPHLQKGKTSCPSSNRRIITLRRIPTYNLILRRRKEKKKRIISQPTARRLKIMMGWEYNSNKNIQHQNQSIYIHRFPNPIPQNKLFQAKTLVSKITPSNILYMEDM
ncbi:unnamed protein product (macronuclear) [Paramecium tetraurelia]|uniref:Uncharacterized protein n=1 Tax=Paramecium tetraurelia TaxID=5888 RepID=A0C4U2_PARTE|nr:uncharacterized protein GSPATT00006308001 [Paramecium tetraurelia]CAK65809.1 unnamed protein product [Paramecium tetraurelia]|eukprot:XP_001433206.1 hypothetical protein (macronuclear) [Paramecium tetraurelia strain d4-2]